LYIVACFKVVKSSANIFSPHDHMVFIKHSRFLQIRFQIVMPFMRSFRTGSWSSSTWAGAS
jgi:hypothetical protein